MKPLPESRYKTTWRSHACGELSLALEGHEVTLCGALESKEGDGLYDVRDTYGLARVRLRPGVGEEDLKRREMSEPPLASIVQVTGTVTKREKPDAKTPAGAVFVDASKIEYVSFSQKDLLFDPQDPNVSEGDRVRHRYLYLRAPHVHENFRFRTKVRAELRNFLVANRFEEVETPLLANKWTPDAADTYLAIRNRREIFALPGHGNSVHGVLLMASGFDRVFEIARRFRRIPHYSAWQQPEYDVLDATMAYVDETDLFDTADALLAHTWREVLGPRERFQVTTLTADEALRRYGTLTPDLRFSLEIFDAGPLAAQAKSGAVRELPFNGGAIRAVRAPGGDDKLVENDPALLEHASRDATLHWLSFKDDNTPLIQGTGDFDVQLAAEILRATHAEKGDRVIVALGREDAVVHLAGLVRAHVGKKLKAQERKHALARVTRLPFWRFDAAKQERVASGDPLAMPVAEELEGSDPKALHSLGFSLVLDGVKVGGGAVRNHDLQSLGRVLETLKLTARDIDQRYGALIQALKYGLPPHARFTIGVDRLAALLRGLDGISEMIPLPKTQEGLDPLTRSPWPIDNHVVRGLFAL